MGDISENLSMAVDRLPQMTEAKKKVDMHVKIASKILEEIRARQIDKLQDIEDEIITQRYVSGENKTDLQTILDNPHGSFLDKVRLLVIMILCLKDLDELSQYIQTVT